MAHDTAHVASAIPTIMALVAGLGFYRGRACNRSFHDTHEGLAAGRTRPESPMLTRACGGELAVTQPAVETIPQRLPLQQSGITPGHRPAAV